MGELLKPTYVGDTELPYVEGKPAGPTIYGKDVAPVGRSAIWTLTGMTQTHRFLVPAALQAAGLAADPIALYWAEHNLPPQEAPYVVDLGWSAFSGLVPPEDRIVFACPTVHARGLVDYLARVQFGSSGQLDWESLHQRLPIVDRQLLNSMTIQPPHPPTVLVDVFGLTGPRGTYFWTPPTDPWTGSLQWSFRPPRAEKPPRKGRRRST